MTNFIEIFEIEDSKERIVAALFNSQLPMKISEISQDTFMSSKLVSYHLKPLINFEVAFYDPEDKTYRLADIFYKHDLMEMLEDAFTPIAEFFAKSSDDIKTTRGIIANLKLSVELFCLLQYQMSPEEELDMIEEDIGERGYLILKDSKYPCLSCGKEIVGTVHVYPEGHWVSKQFCSPECQATNQSEMFSGENSPNWKGGVSFEPYCKKFDNKFKTRCREFFENKCVVCGITTEQNKRKMCVHHVNYNKDTCCDENVKQLFVTLCAKHHGLTNHSRDYWNEKFTKLIEEEYDGKCFYTKAEWKNILLSKKSCKTI
jgi:hypothetical protein